MVADFQEGELDVSSKRFKVITALCCFVGLFGVISGKNPVQVQILTQVFNVFVLPLVILCILILINKSSLMGAYKATLSFNIALVFALIFSFIISYNGVFAVIEQIGIMQQ